MRECDANLAREPRYATVGYGTVGFVRGDNRLHFVSGSPGAAVSRSFP